MGVLLADVESRALLVGAPVPWELVCGHFTSWERYLPWAL